MLTLTLTLILNPLQVIRAWGDTKQPQQAEECLSQMRDSGVAPDQFCYNSVINAWADAKKPERAEAVLREAPHNPTSTLVPTLSSSLSYGRTNEVPNRHI